MTEEAPSVTMSSGETHRPAPHGLRASAWIVDLLLVLLVFAFLPQPISILLFLTLFIAYHTILIWLVGQTVGKALVGLRVNRPRGKRGILWALLLGLVGGLFPAIHAARLPITVALRGE